MGGFQEMAVKFRSYHQNTLNVALHMVTTPAAVVAVLVVALQQLSLQVFGGLVAAYVLSLAPTLRSPRCRALPIRSPTPG